MAETKKLEVVPSGIEHIGFAVAVNKKNRNISEPILREFKPQLDVLGTSLGGIYTSATCFRKCHGGDHIIEAIGSRIYNLAAGSYSLICIGLYDEAQSLIRSIGEISNILSLTTSNPSLFREWVNSSKQERIQKFSPAKIRKSLENSGIVIMDNEWYSELCESYTHITPNVTPNNYELNRNVCGGIVQKEGLKKSLDQLTNIAAITALYLCSYSDLDDIFEELSNKWEMLDEDES